MSLTFMRTLNSGKTRMNQLLWHIKNLLLVAHFYLASPPFLIWGFDLLKACVVETPSSFQFLKTISYSMIT